MRETGEVWLLDTPPSALAIPSTLHDSLMARLDRLQPVKEVAQAAAVIGRGFDHRTVAALTALPEEELVGAMRRLVEAELVFRRGSPPEATYLFKHALVRDAAYESLLRVKRVALHARLLDILERHGDAAPEIMAQHAEAAGLTKKALDYWQQAGEQALARPAYKEAVTRFGAAIRLCRQVGEGRIWRRRELQLLVQLGRALLANLGYAAPATMAAFERAVELADGLGETSLLWEATFGLWVSRYVAGRRSSHLAERLAELTDGSGETAPGSWRSA